MQLEEVWFNHNTSGATTDAITIALNASSGAVTAPEWKLGQPSKPAAYARDAITGPVTIKAKFSGGPLNGTRKIRAIDPNAVAPSGCAGIIQAIVNAIVGSVGEVNEKVVSFSGSGVSGLETFTLTAKWLTPQGFVSKRTNLWRWQYLENGVWIDFATSENTIYVLLAIPHAPWVQSGDATQLPWASALDLACSWGVGASTLDVAAERITWNVNRVPNVSYTPVTMFGYFDYQLGSYMTHVNGGAPFVMNCTDCADAVTTLSNLLGCTLAEGRFETMNTKPFLTLSGDPADPADWVTFNWSYHEICFLNDFSSNLCWDGCLQLDMSNNPAVHVAKLPVKMIFNGGPDDYKARLIQSGPGSIAPPVQHRKVV